MNSDKPLNSITWAAFHAVAWLVIGNLVGLILAFLLLFPQLNDILSPFTYGRWMPLHLDFQLYGWCGFPLVILLFKLYLTIQSRYEKWGSWAVWAWSAILVLGGWEWLHGRDGGKIFLDWSGIFRYLFPVVIGVLWFILLMGYFDQLQSRVGHAQSFLSKMLKGVFLLTLAIVPYVFYKVLDPGTYPAINRSSGGPTGTSLLGSILGVVVLFWIFPVLTGVERKNGLKPLLWTGLVLALHFLFFIIVPHGHTDFQSNIQVLALGSSLIWIPILNWYLRQFSWPVESKQWLYSFGFWGISLCVTGFVSFFPGILEQAKFTNVLVAHAHLAMAGMMTSFNILLIVLLVKTSIVKNIFSSRSLFVLWHIGLAAFIASTTIIGIFEGDHYVMPFRGGAVTAALYAVRLLGGAILFGVSFVWLKNMIQNILPDFKIGQNRRKGAVQ